MDIKVNVDNAREVMETLRLKPEQIKQVSKHAVARTLAMTKTDINRKAREVYTVKAGELTKSLKVVKAGLSGIIVSTGSPLPLTAFKMSPAKVTKTKRRLSAEVKKGGLKPIKRGFLIAKGPYQRTSVRRYPIKRPYGPSAPQMFGEDSVLDSINKKATENLEKRLVHEIGRVLK
ncbi:hypothetical protein [Sebaldella termitidis]|uniref:hypothetical protein n=1 Tax=Sebaldella termitidis TaxID=826 RepID=UPI003EBBB0D6